MDHNRSSQGGIAAAQSSSCSQVCLSRRDYDRCQAIYCLEHVQSRIRPVGHGLILTRGGLFVLIVARLSDPIMPYLRGLSDFVPKGLQDSPRGFNPWCRLIKMPRPKRGGRTREPAVPGLTKRTFDNKYLPPRTRWT